MHLSVSTLSPSYSMEILSPALHKHRKPRQQQEALPLVWSSDKGGRTSHDSIGENKTEIVLLRKELLQGFLTTAEYMNLNLAYQKQETIDDSPSPLNHDDVESRKPRKRTFLSLDEQESSCVYDYSTSQKYCKKQSVATDC